MHLDPEHLALLALGDEPIDPDAAAHLASCRTCREEYATIRDVADLGRARDLPAPPARVWDGIMRQILSESPLLSESQAAAIAASNAGPRAADTGRTTPDGGDAGMHGQLEGSPGHSLAHSHPPAVRAPADRDSTDHAPADRDPADREPVYRDTAPPDRPDISASAAGARRGRRLVGAAALAVIVAAIAVAGTLGVMAVRHTDGTTLVSRTQLAAQPGAPSSARGSAEVVRVGTETELRLTLTGMPTPSGYYEAWLVDPETGEMYPMGPVMPNGGTVTVTGVDVGRYRGVDISAQAMDGGGGHGRTMLSGALR